MAWRCTGANHRDARSVLNSSLHPVQLKLYAGSAASPVVFDKTGIGVLGCNIHDNMTAWVVIVDTPYYGRSAPPRRRRR